MVKLSEEMIVARTRQTEMANVKKLNCWGAELTDVTVLRNLVNVEVLSLSVNCITTLADIQYCTNLQELYIRKNQIQDLNEICWLRNLTKLKNLWLEENPCAQGGEIYRMTVIKNLPQLQKLDNVMVQPDEVGESMRRGVELVHPHDRPIPGQMVDDNLAYNYGPHSYQSGYGGRKGSQMAINQSTYPVEDGYVPEYHTGRRYSNQDQVPVGSNSRRSSRGISQHSVDEQMRRSMSLASQQEAPAYEENERMVNSYAPAEMGGGRRASEAAYTTSARYDRSNNSTNHTNHGGLTSAGEKRASNGTPSPAGSTKSGGRSSKTSSPLTSTNGSKKSTNSSPNSSKPSSPTSSLAKSGIASNGLGGKKFCNSCGGNGKNNKPTPSTHFALNGRAASHQSIEVIHLQQSSTHPNEPNVVGSISHPLNFRSLQLVQERSQSVPRQNGGTSTNGDTSPTNISNNSPCELKETYTMMDSERNVVAQHYEQTFDQVNQQIDSARQLVEIRKQSRQSPERPYPRRPKNRNSNILSAVLCLIKELDGPSLEVAEMAVRCRMEELED